MSEYEPEPALCAAHFRTGKKAGQPCPRPAIPGSTFCQFHATLNDPVAFKERTDKAAAASLKVRRLKAKAKRARRLQLRDHEHRPNNPRGPKRLHNGPARYDDLGQEGEGHADRFVAALAGQLRG